ncbi:cyclic nucleotide-binding domain-containing protein [Actinomadura yumaensis]
MARPDLSPQQAYAQALAEAHAQVQAQTDYDRDEAYDRDQLYDHDETYGRDGVYGLEPGPVPGQAVPFPGEAYGVAQGGHHVRHGGHVSTVSFWQALTTGERAALAAAASSDLYPAGQVVWREGHVADHVLVILAGEVKVCVERAGLKRVLATRGPGDLIGERAALSLHRRSATIIALDDVQALRLPTRDFAAFLYAHRRVLTVLEGQMYDRLTEPPGRPYGPAGIPSEDAQAPYAGLRPPYTFYEDVRVMYEGVPYGDPRNGDPRDDYGLRDAYDPRDGYDPRDVRGPEAGPTGTAYGAAQATRGEAWTPHGSAQTPHAEAWPPMERTRRNAPPIPARYESYAAPRPGQPAGPPAWAGQMCSILFTDIAGFGALHRNDDDRLAMRRAMYDLTREAFEASNVPWEACHREDRGDGALIVVPPWMPTRSVVDPMLAVLTAGLRRHNRRASAAVRIQLRVALHVGPVMPDAEG